MEHERTRGRTDAAWIAALVSIAALLRLIHVLTIRDTPYFAYLMLDPRMYDEWAQRIAAGDWLGQRPFFQDPLYPYLLGAAYRVFGHYYTPVVLLQSLCGAATAGLTYAATLRGFGRGAARFAGLAAALYLPSIYYEGLILKTWLAAFLVAATLYLLSRARVGGPRRTWLLAGAALGLACLTRGNLTLFLPVAAAWALLDAPGVDGAARPRERIASPAAWGAVACLLAAGVGLLGATAIRNRAVGGEWILTTSNAGQNFYIGNNPLNTNGQYTRLPFVDPNPKYEERDFEREARSRTGRDLTPAAVSRFWLREALGWIRSHPGDWVGLTWKKLRNYWGAYELPDNLDYYLYRRSAPVLRLPLPGFGLVAPLALVGAVLALRRPGWPRLLLLFVATYSVSVVSFFVFSRFRMPMMPALFPLAGLAVTELAARVRRARAAGGERAPLVGAALLLALFLAGVNLPARGPADGLVLRVARGLGLPVRAETSSSGHFNLGVAYAARAKEAEDPREFLRLAEGELRAALAVEQRFAETYVELGKVLARQALLHTGPEAEALNREAIDLYVRAGAIEPADPRNPHALGLLYTRTGERAAAAEAYRQALALSPRHVASSTKLGELLLEEGRFAEAELAFAHTLGLRPDDAAAQRGLAAARERIRN